MFDNGTFPIDSTSKLNILIAIEKYSVKLDAYKILFLGGLIAAALTLRNERESKKGDLDGLKVILK